MSFVSAAQIWKSVGTCYVYVGMAPRDNPLPGTGLMLDSGCTCAHSLKLVAASLQHFCGEPLKQAKKN